MTGALIRRLDPLSRTRGEGGHEYPIFHFLNVMPPKRRLFRSRKSVGKFRRRSASKSKTGFRGKVTRRVASRKRSTKPVFKRRRTSVRSSRQSGMAGFRKKVLLATSTPAKLTSQGALRMQWTTAEQYSSLSTGAATTIQLYDPNTIANQIYTMATVQQMGPTGGTGVLPGAPIDYWIQEAEIVFTLQNQSPVTVFGTMWQLRARYDTNDTVYDQYTNALAEQGETGATILPGSASAIDTDPYSTPFLYRSLMQCQKVEKSYKLKITAGQQKTIRIRIKRWVHVTSRMLSVLQLAHLTRNFLFNWYGTPVNLLAAPNSPFLSNGGVNLFHSRTYRYVLKPQPYSFNDIILNTNGGPGATGQAMVVNQPTVLVGTGGFTIA